MGLDRYATDGQAEVARATGLSPSAISRIFDGSRNPSALAAERIAEHLGITVPELHAELVALRAARRRAGAA